MREQVREDPPVIPVDEELPMDWYNIEARRYQDDRRKIMKYNNDSFVYLFEQMNIVPRPGPGFAYVPSWEERLQARRNQASGSGTGGNEEDDDD